VTPQVVVAGHICLDIIPRFRGGPEFTPGRLIEVGPAELSTGGCVANVGRALHRLGVPVRLIGKIGQDPFGEVLRGVLDAESPSLSESLVASPGGTTSYSVVLSPLGADRTFLHMPGENDTFRTEDVLTEHLDGTKIFHFGYPPLMAAMYENRGEELVRLFQRVHEVGIITSLDLSLPDPNSPSGQAPWREILARVLPFVDLFVPSEEELSFMLGSHDIDWLSNECLKMGAGTVVIKRGELGLVARTADSKRLTRISPTWSNQSAYHPCFPVNVKGTTGAGDASIAGFLRGLLGGQTLSDSLQTACAVGASCVEASDAVSGIRSWQDTQRRLETEWAT
jgi:sugar/nucleoside kinase (ribokinase family)